MATQKDLEAIYRHHSISPDDAIRFVREHPWGAGENKKPETEWPRRDYDEVTEDYLIRMVQQLFVEIAQVKAMLEKPLYQINVPPLDEMMSTVPLHPLTRSMYGSYAVDDGDTNDRSDDIPSTPTLEDT